MLKEREEDFDREEKSYLKSARKNNTIRRFYSWTSISTDTETDNNSSSSEDAKKMESEGKHLWDRKVNGDETL